MPPTSRSLGLSLAGVILALDGVAAWLLSVATWFLMSFSMAAIEGRTDNPNGHLVWWVLGFLALGVVAFIAARRAVRRDRRGRLLGALVAVATALVAAAFSWSAAAATQASASAFAAGVVVLLAQLGVLYVLASWPPEHA